MSNIEQTLTERGATHGDWARQSNTAQELKQVMRFAPNANKLTDSQTEALELIMTKISRILCGDPNVADHWEDIAGYATLPIRKPSTIAATPARHYKYKDAYGVGVDFYV